MAEYFIFLFYSVKKYCYNYWSINWYILFYYVRNMLKYNELTICFILWSQLCDCLHLYSLPPTATTYLIIKSWYLFLNKTVSHQIYCFHWTRVFLWKSRHSFIYIKYWINGSTSLSRGSMLKIHSTLCFVLLEEELVCQLVKLTRIKTKLNNLFCSKPIPSLYIQKYYIDVENKIS